MKHHTTVEASTLRELATELKDKSYIEQDELNKVFIAIGSGDAMKMNVLHSELLKIRSKHENKDPKIFADTAKFWDAVENEVQKINGLIGIYHKTSGATSYVIRDLKVAGDRDYIEKTGEKDIKQWLTRAGINIRLTLKTPDSEKPLNVDTFERWVTSPLAEEQALVGFTSVPYPANKPPIPIIGKKLNVFRSGFVVPEKGDSHLEVLHFLKDCICNNNEYIYEVLIKWMAHLVQKPEEKNNLAMSAYHVRRGIGKGTLASIIHLLVGERNSTLEADPKDLAGFNSLLAGKLFINFDEVAFVGDHHSTGVLKKMVTEGKERQEKKGKDASSARSYCRILMTTNTRTGTIGSAFERRYFDLPIQTTWKDQGIIDNFVKTHHLKETDAQRFLVDGRFEIPWVKSMTYYLLNEVSLEGFNFNEVLSVAADEDTIENRIHNTYREDAIFAWLWEWLNSGEESIEFSRWDDETKKPTEVVDTIKFGERNRSTKQIGDAFAQRVKGMYSQPVSYNALIKELQSRFGFIKFNAIPIGGGNKVNVMSIPPRAELFKIMFTDNQSIRVTWQLPPLKPVAVDEFSEKRMMAAEMVIDAEGAMTVVSEKANVADLRKLMKT